MEGWLELSWNASGMQETPYKWNCIQSFKHGALCSAANMFSLEPACHKSSVLREAKYNETALEVDGFKSTS